MDIQQMRYVIERQIDIWLTEAFTMLKQVAKHVFNKNLDCQTYDRESYDPIAIPTIKPHWRHPIVSIVTPVYSVPLAIFEETVKSVLDQTYSRWRWYIGDASPEDDLWHYIATFSRTDKRIHAIRLKKNEGISGNTNQILKRVKGEYVIFLDHDDLLSPHAIAALVENICRHAYPDVLFSDSDKVNEVNDFVDVFYKPDWSPEMLLSANYITHLTCIRKQLFDRVGEFRPENDGAQDWDMYLRLSRVTNRFVRIPMILYHWRIHKGSTALDIQEKPYVQNAQLSAITDHLEQQALKNVRVYFDKSHLVHRVHPIPTWDLPPNSIISVIVNGSPLVDYLQYLRDTIEHPRYEIIWWDSAKLFIEHWDNKEQINRQEFPLPSTDNVVKLINYACEKSSGAYSVILDKRLKPKSSRWLTSLVQWVVLENVVMASPRLYYDDNKIDYAGLIASKEYAAGLYFMRHHHAIIHGKFGSDSWIRNVDGVSVYCFVMTQDIYQTLNCFDESLDFIMSVLDFSLRARQLGKRLVYTPHVEFTTGHYISDNDHIDAKSFIDRWYRQLPKTSLYWNPNLVLKDWLPQ